MSLGAVPCRVALQNGDIFSNFLLLEMQVNTKSENVKRFEKKIEKNSINLIIGFDCKDLNVFCGHFLFGSSHCLLTTTSTD